MNEEKQELLEIYKLHAELADRVSQRREGANRLYVSLLTGLLIFLSVLIRFGAEEISTAIVLCAGGIFGTALSISWFIVIRSYRQLNAGKFSALDELENRLSFPFFRREWEILEQGKNRNKYWRLTVVETFLPIVFGILFLSVAIFPCFI